MAKLKPEAPATFADEKTIRPKEARRPAPADAHIMQRRRKLERALAAAERELEAEMAKQPSLQDLADRIEVRMQDSGEPLSSPSQEE
jgi:hypothetical protein